MTGDITEQREGELGVIAQDVGRDREEVVARARADAPAHALDGRRDLIGGARRRALGQQLGRQGRDSFFAGGIIRRSGPEAQAHGKRGLLVIFDEHERHAVRQRDFLERREPHGPEALRRGRTGGHLVLSRQAVERLGGLQHRDRRSDRPSAEPTDRRHWAPPGPARTITSVRLLGARYVFATRFTSSLVTASIRSRSVLISSNELWTAR